MTDLCSHQRQLTNLLVRTATGGSTRFPTTLLIGSSGSGKKTIALRTAAELGFEFVEVPLNDGGGGLQERLLEFYQYTEGDKRKSDSDRTTGIQRPILLYFSGLQLLQANQFHPFHRLVARLEFILSDKAVRRLAEDVWVVASMTTPARQFNITGEHWVCTAFDRRIEIDVPKDTLDLAQIGRSVLKEHGLFSDFDEEAERIISEARHAPDHLHALRRWLENARSGDEPQARLAAPTLRRAMARDLKWILPRVPYRGREIGEDEFGRWWNQFPDVLRPLALHLIGQIADHYYIGTTRFYESLDTLIRGAGIPRGSVVAFCKWQRIGQSAPRMANALKNQADWHPIEDIDIEGPESAWPRGNLDWIILADDFIGSGKTVCDLVAQPNGPLRRLLRRYPKARIRILVAAGFEDGVRQLRTKVAALDRKVAVVVARLFQRSDSCFDANSKVVSEESARALLKDFCESGAPALQGLRPEFRLGFRGVGALVVFFDTVPNNSLPILWYGRGDWFPLFPASGLPNSSTT